MKHFFLLFIWVLCWQEAACQTTIDRNEKRRLKKEADYAFEMEDYARAWPLYQALLGQDPGNELAALNAAISSFQLGYDPDSIGNLEAQLSHSSLIDAGFFYALLLHRQKHFDEAISRLEKYRAKNAAKRMFGIEEINYRIHQSQAAKELMARKTQARIRNIGTAINSPYPDYVPVIMPDESALYFTSKRPGVSTEKNGDRHYFEDIFVSKRNNSEWLPAQLLSAPLNTGNNDACVAIGPGGDRMLIYRTSDDRRSGDLFQTWLSPLGNWEEPVLLGKEINSAYTESSACFSNDTNELYFSSDRPGGFGGKDLYRIRKLPDGRWSQPFNLGKTVNTSRDEDAPFMHPDGKTLYFSSKGHQNMGGYDVFKTIYDPEQNTYSQAENLGFPVNDVKDDIFFVLSVDGQRAYYSSVKDQTQGGSDIYEIDTRFAENELQVQPGLVRLEGTPGKAEVTLVEADSGLAAGTYLPHAATGKFIMILNPYKRYTLRAEAPGYHSLSLDLPPLAGTSEIRMLELDLRKKENQ